VLLADLRQDAHLLAVDRAALLAIFLLAAVIAAWRRTDAVAVAVFHIAVGANAAAEIIRIGRRIEGWRALADTDAIGWAARLAANLQLGAAGGRAVAAGKALLATATAALAALLRAAAAGALLPFAGETAAALLVLGAFLANLLATGGHICQSEPAQPHCQRARRECADSAAA
jgi:hypothetical protein